MKIILASASPRRKDLLNLMDIKFDCEISNTEEDMSQKVNYKKLSEILSEQKAQAVFSKHVEDCCVIGSDTMVVLNKKIYGKPHSETEARKMLESLSGKTHKVVTGLCVLIKKQTNINKYLTYSVTKVKFCKLSTKDIDWYISTKEWQGKAGSYAIQGFAGKFIEKINGDYATVIGLPCNLLHKILRKENLA